MRFVQPFPNGRNQEISLRPLQVFPIANPADRLQLVGDEGDYVACLRSGESWRWNGGKWASCTSRILRPGSRGNRGFLGYINSAAAPALDVAGITELVTCEAGGPYYGIRVYMGCRSKASEAVVMEWQTTAASGTSLATNADINGQGLTFSNKLTWPANRAKSGDPTTGRFDSTNLSTSTVTFNGEVLAESDFIEMRSGARVDIAGNYPTIVIRNHILPTTSGAGGTAVIKNRGGTSWFPAGSWNNNPLGQKLWIRSMVGQKLDAGVVGSSFTSTAEVSSHYIAGVAIYYVGGAINYVTVGGSTACGGRDTFFQGNNLSVANEMTLHTGIIHEYSFVGIAEVDSRSFREQVSSHFPYIRPDIVLVDCNDIGDLYAATSQANANAQFTTRTTRSGPTWVEDYTRSLNPDSFVMYRTGVPTGVGFPSIGDGDLVRKADNAEKLANPYLEGRISDFASQIGDGSSPREYLAPWAAGANNFHPSPAGFEANRPSVTEILKRNIYANA